MLNTFKHIRRVKGCTVAYQVSYGEVIITAWNTKNDVLKVLEVYSYEGRADQRAAESMAKGFIDTVVLVNGNAFHC
jgi:hypothetical protein